MRILNSMTKNDVKLLLEEKALEVTDFSAEDRRKAVDFLFQALEEKENEKDRSVDEVTKALDPKFETSASWGNWPVVSLKPENFFISWTKLGFLTGKGAAAIAASKGLVLLGVIVAGTTHIYDEEDSAIIKVIHDSSDCLPMSTGQFYDRFKSKFPSTINKESFMRRVVRLADCGAITIDNDTLNVREVLYQFGKST